MIAAKISWNRTKRVHEVAITKIESICGVEKNTYYFDSARQAIGYLVTVPTIGPDTLKQPNQRCALIAALMKHAGGSSRVENAAQCFIDGHGTLTIIPASDIA